MEQNHRVSDYLRSFFENELLPQKLTRVGLFAFAPDRLISVHASGKRLCPGE
jgi:hypothetical protein